MYKHKKSKATDIPYEVKEKVWERDRECCVICGSPNASPCAHYISRAHNGLGIEQNIVTLCQECHDRFDNGDKRIDYGLIIRDYLEGIYPAWSEEMVTYDKYSWLKE